MSGAEELNKGAAPGTEFDAFVGVKRGMWPLAIIEGDRHAVAWLNDQSDPPRRMYRVRVVVVEEVEAHRTPTTLRSKQA